MFFFEFHHFQCSIHAKLYFRCVHVAAGGTLHCNRIYTVLKWVWNQFFRLYGFWFQVFWNSGNCDQNYNLREMLMWKIPPEFCTTSLDSKLYLNGTKPEEIEQRLLKALENRRHNSRAGSRFPRILVDKVPQNCRGAKLPRIPRYFGT